MKYLDLTGLETVVNNILSKFQQTYQADINILQTLQSSSYPSGADVTAVLNYNTAVEIASALMANKCVIFNGGEANAFVPMLTAWAQESSTVYDFGLVYIVESYNNFYAVKMYFSANKTDRTVTMYDKNTKTL